VPQELTTDAFETVWATVSFSRGLFGKAPEPGAHREGAARPVAVGQEGHQDHDAVGRHEAPRADRQGAVARAASILFLDEPTAGVDVELRRDMWQLVRALRDRASPSS
jgi:ABC-2 type transport system ATP-binding protein